MTDELVLDQFDEEAQRALGEAQALAEERFSRVDTRFLLAGLASNAALWPEGWVDTRVQMHVPARLGMATTEEPGRIQFGQVKLSKLVEEVLDGAFVRSRQRAMAQVPVELVLAELAEASGSDATQMVRALRGVADPWRDVRRHLARLEGRAAPTQNGALPELEDRPGAITRAAPSAYERVVALVYTLIRDDVGFGTVTRVVGELEQHPGADYRYTNPEGEALARKLVDRLWR